MGNRFLVVQERDALPKNVPLREVALKDRYTKSASFARFLQKDERVAIVMEPALNEAELIALFEITKDVHPAEPLGAPGEFNGRLADRRGQSMAALRSISNRYSEWFTIHDELLEDETIDPTPPKTTVAQCYYLRVGKLKEKFIKRDLVYLDKMRTKDLVSEVHVYPEWLTNNVGGVRIEVYVPKAKLDEVWKSRETYYSRKLPKGIRADQIASQLSDSH